MNPYLGMFAAACIPAVAMLLYTWEDDTQKDARIKKELYMARARTANSPANGPALLIPTGQSIGQNSLKDQQLLAFIFAHRHETDISKVLLENQDRPISEDPEAQEYLRKEMEKNKERKE